MRGMCARNRKKIGNTLRQAREKGLSLSRKWRRGKQQTRVLSVSVMDGCEWRREHDG